MVSQALDQCMFRVVDVVDPDAPEAGPIVQVEHEIRSTKKVDGSKSAARVPAGVAATPRPRVYGMSPRRRRIVPARRTAAGTRAVRCGRCN